MYITVDDIKNDISFDNPNNNRNGNTKFAIKEQGNAKLFLSTYLCSIQNSMDWKSSIECAPYFKKHFETPCIK